MQGGQISVERPYAGIVQSGGNGIGLLYLPVGILHDHRLRPV